MIKLKNLAMLLLLFSISSMLKAQKRDINLKVEVTTSTGESLDGQVVTLEQTDYSLDYGELRLDENGSLDVNIYSGHHRLTIARKGYNTYAEDFDATSNMTIKATLTEKTQTPYSLTTKLNHDVFSGRNEVVLGWNQEKPSFFDDFESYSPFSINFGHWTGIDADGEQAAALTGDYSNRGAMMYAQIINPMTVVPAWWYDYPVLRPYSGQQYAGFIRTNSGRANNDWLISPEITPGTDNVLTFMAKAGDVGKERFQTYITEQTNNPSTEDFVKLGTSNYESVGYEEWQKMTYDLSAYAGKKVKIAIRYISEANTQHTFMLMVDDFMVGQRETETEPSAAKRIQQHSPANPNETFNIYVDGTLAGTTENYSYTIEDIAPGNHKLGVKAVYKASESDIAETEINVPKDNMAHYTFNVTTNNGMSADGSTLQIVDKESGISYNANVADGHVTAASLPYGEYLIGMTVKNFDTFEQQLDVTGDGLMDISLKETIVKPYNITAETTKTADGFDVDLRWNQSLSFTDNFDCYDDFAQGSFGEWKSIDLDQGAVYPIGLGSESNIVTFPGASTPSNPTAIAPIVFNPWTTSPSMMPLDATAMTPPSGQKQIVFFSPQGKQADKWLISPQMAIMDGYVMKVTAKSYSDIYPETIEMCVSTTDGSTSSFVPIAKAENMPADQWTIYEADLSEYAGQKVWLAIHYISYDTFLAQLDDFYVGTRDGEGQYADVGAVKKYEISLDGSGVGSTSESAYTLHGVKDGSHTVGIKAVYESGTSEMAEYVFDTSTAGIGSDRIVTEKAESEYYTLDGMRISPDKLRSGIYIRKTGNSSEKIVVK